MPRVYSADSSASPAEAWSLIAEPRRWSEWAPHVRGAWGLGDPEVQAGERGAARLAGVLPIPARITAKEPGRSWTWRVGPVVLVHAVHPTPVGCRVSITVDGPGLLTAAYGPVVDVMVKRLARTAERRPSASVATSVSR